MRPGSERHPSWHVVAGRCFRAPATSSWARCTRSYAVVAGGQIPPSVAGPLPCGLPACALAAAAAAAMRGTRVVVTVQLDTSTYRTALCGWVPMSKGQGVIVCIKDLSSDHILAIVDFPSATSSIGEGNPPPHVPHRYDRGVAYAHSDITGIYLLILCEASVVRRNDLHLYVGHIDGSSWTGETTEGESRLRFWRTRWCDCSTCLCTFLLRFPELFIEKLNYGFCRYEFNHCYAEGRSVPAKCTKHCDPSPRIHYAYLEPRLEPS